MKVNKWQENFEYEISMKTRYERLLQMIEGGYEYTSVCDLGCGPQYLKDILCSEQSMIKYVGVDLYRHKDTTIVCDFNKKEFISLDEKYDIVMCAGVLEYIYEMKSFIRNISKITGRYFLCTYHFDEYTTKRADIWTEKLWKISPFLQYTDKCGLKLVKFNTKVCTDNSNRNTYMVFEKYEKDKY